MAIQVIINRRFVREKEGVLARWLSVCAPSHWANPAISPVKR